jgi:hypothetical protein
VHGLAITLPLAMALFCLSVEVVFISVFRPPSKVLIGCGWPVLVVTQSQRFFQAPLFSWVE